MKLTCLKQELSAAANHISRVVSVKSPLPVLSGILMTAKGNKLSLFGYDLELGMTTEIPASIDKEGTAVVEAKLFCDIVRRLPDDNVTITVDERNLCKIISGRSEFSLLSINPDEYPELPTVDNGKSITIPTTMLQSMVNQTSFAVADVGSSKPILTGINFKISGGEFKMVGMDGYRIAIRTEKIGSDEEMQFTVPAKALGEVLKLISDGNDITINASNRHIIFDVDGYKVISRLLDGEYFDYTRAVPTVFNTTVTGNTAQLTSTIERISQVIIERLKTPIICNFDNGVFCASCMTEIGNAKDEINVEMSGESVNMGFNSKYLIDALRAADTDIVKINIGSSLSPITIVPPEGDEFIFVVLPVKIR